MVFGGIRWGRNGQKVVKRSPGAVVSILGRFELGRLAGVAVGFGGHRKILRGRTWRVFPTNWCWGKKSWGIVGIFGTNACKTQFCMFHRPHGRTGKFTIRIAWQVVWVVALTAFSLYASPQEVSMSKNSNAI